MSKMTPVTVRLEKYQITTIEGIAKKNGESFSDVHRRMIDFATNKVSENCIAVSLDEHTNALLRSKARERNLTESDFAAQILTNMIEIL